MDRIEGYDQRLKETCVQCGTGLRADNPTSDHVPSKCFLSRTDGPAKDEYPSELPVVPTCGDSNGSFSQAEEYMNLLLHCVLAGSTEPRRHTDPRVCRALIRHGRLRKAVDRSKRM